MYIKYYENFNLLNPVLLILLLSIMFSCKKELQSNAQILSFNPDKCSCCWGWTIKIGNDTIKSDTDLIKIALGSNIEYPVNVHIEKGIFENECSNYSNSFYDYYQITKIEIID